MIKITPLEKKIKITKSDLNVFIRALELSKKKAFSGIHQYNYSAPVKEREEMISISLDYLNEKLLNKFLNNTHKFDTAKLTINFNLLDEKAFNIILSRVDFDPYTLAVLTQISQNLRTLNTQTNSIQMLNKMQTNSLVQRM